MNINKCICTGRLTKDPELRKISEEMSVCQLRLAVDGMGRAREVGYINVSVFGKAAEALCRISEEGLARGGRRAPGVRRVGDRRCQTP